VIPASFNLPEYSWDRGSPHHEVARNWLDARLNETARVEMPWESTLGFLLVVTNPRIYQRPETIARAWGQVEEWLTCGNVWIPRASDEHEVVLGGLLRHLGGGSTLIPDAHLAVLAIEHGLTLCSSDGDFARFPGLRWLNPLKT
jgi:toxin-antitoxin system PIN domain toxin